MVVLWILIVIMEWAKISFSIRNGLKLAWAHLHDEQMLLAWVFFMVPGLAAFGISLFAPCVYWMAFNLIYVLIRCWDDPVQLGWCDT